MGSFGEFWLFLIYFYPHFIFFTIIQYSSTFYSLIFESLFLLCYINVIRKELYTIMRQLISTMFKIGAIGFGGGTALIPVIEEEVVNNKLVDEDEFNKDVIVANITPGALPVEIASGIGRSIRGIRGMIAAAFMMALPGSLLTILILSLISQSSEGVLRQIMFASAGVTAYIIFMLHEYLNTTITVCKRSNIKAVGILFVVLVCALTCGKEFYQLVDMLSGSVFTPMFDISTVQILIIAFFIIFYTEGRFSLPKLFISTAITIPYCMCVGKAHVIESAYILWGLRALMLVLALYGLFTSVTDKPKFSMSPLKRLIKEEAAWVLFLLVCSVPAIILCNDSLLFLGKGIISALMSFGGGDAYLAVADGLFVESGLVSYSDFYSKIASVANALPGSILCKVLAGVGYYVGNVNGIAAALAVAFSGFACSVAASGGTFSAVNYLYERFEKLDIFQAIKLYIRPIVAGLLLTVSVSMLCQNISIADAADLSAAGIVIITLVIYGLNIVWRHFTNLKPIVCVGISAVISLAACNVLGMM